jgi:DNA-binding transcriptional MerR regulator
VEKVRYMISDAANIAGVESHVLRYWEDELELDIPRNEMGHRYYTKENIQQFQRIKELKEQGYQLKSIRMILHNNGVEPPAVTKEEHPAGTKEGMSAEERMAQFRELMSDIVGRAIAQNNEELSQNIGVEVQERVLKEMNYLMREQEDAAEDRYKKLDAAIRGELKKRRFLFSKKETVKSDAGTKKKVRPVEQGT